MNNPFNRIKAFGAQVSNGTRRAIDDSRVVSKAITKGAVGKGILKRAAIGAGIGAASGASYSGMSADGRMGRDTALGTLAGAAGGAAWGTARASRSGWKSQRVKSAGRAKYMSPEQWKKTPAGAAHVAAFDAAANRTLAEDRDWSALRSMTGSGSKPTSLYAANHQGLTVPEIQQNHLSLVNMPSGFGRPQPNFAAAGKFESSANPLVFAVRR